ncbi:MAG: hypothetical protein E5Y10_09755 [Mesorhizobium sp.]|nr:MAG: hypothetical protein E5Y10_09755 [Mesorhizobium sp.]
MQKDGSRPLSPFNVLFGPGKQQHSLNIDWMRKDIRCAAAEALTALLCRKMNGKSHQRRSHAQKKEIIDEQITT